jgi:alkanesulfonate monooxygenase SsuD/methylene tetrahydromethanopterin reductase-like flavin-dependent oxidoreductase (luciferase family)
VTLRPPELALQTPQETTDLHRLGDLWQAADDLGYRAAFTFDHLVPLFPGERPGSRHDGERTGVQLDGWLTAAVLAGRTRSLQVGTLVSGITYRPPVVLAKLAVTLDHATGGRAILGVGAGWHRAEHEMFGLPFPNPTDRLRQLEETVAAFELLCQDATTSFRGTQVQLQDAVFEPKPVRPEGIPVLIGGSSPRLLDVAGRRADIYNGFAAPGEWPAVHDRLDRAALDAGRAPSDVRRSAFVRADLTGDDQRAADLVEQVAVSREEPAAVAATRVLGGSGDALAAGLLRFAAVGVDLVVVSAGPTVTPEDLGRLAAARADVAGGGAR